MHSLWNVTGLKAGVLENTDWARVQVMDWYSWRPCRVMAINPNNETGSLDCVLINVCHKICYVYFSTYMTENRGSLTNKIRSDVERKWCMFTFFIWSQCLLFNVFSIVKSNQAWKWLIMRGTDLGCSLCPCVKVKLCLPVGGALIDGRQRNCWIIHCWIRPSGHLRKAGEREEEHRERISIIQFINAPKHMQEG